MSKNDGNKPRFAVSQWTELRKAGGIAFSDLEIERILEGRETGVLTRQEVLERVRSYFSACTKQVQDEETGELLTTWTRNPTKSGLALCLGITSQTLVDYVRGRNSVGDPYSSENPDYKRVVATEDFDILRRAYAIIEDFYESRLGENRNNSGSIFWLLNSSNTRWSNLQEFQFGTAEPEEKTVRTSSQLLADMRKLTQEKPMQYLPNLNEEEE